MVTGSLREIDGIEHYLIEGLEGMEPFLTTVVSDSDLWMFVSSRGPLTAGRIDADHALFPYVTDDQLHRSAGITGPITIIARTSDDVRQLWRPFDRELTPGCTRSIAKSTLGDRLVFEERHGEWGLRFRAVWAPSSEYGWVRTVELHDERGGDSHLEVLDGFLDVMPSGVPVVIEQSRSNLTDAYKRSETGRWGALAIYSLESLITDRAEPSESLTATTVWSSGFGAASPDLDGRAVAAMLEGRAREPRQLLTGRPGAYLLRGPVTVPSGGSVSWHLVADIGLGHADVEVVARTAQEPHAMKAVAEDVAAGSGRLRSLLAAVDGFQSTADPVADAHHLSNVLFNSMRGGLFPFGPEVPVADLVDFVTTRDRRVAERCADWFATLGPSVHVATLRASVLDHGDDDLARLVLEYLPLAFSRRHGDPSRPWNRFSIHVRDEHGRAVMSYEGNWRDIFQNWEALLRSNPAFHLSVVATFVDASTIEGFNPYRISRAGVDWEVPDPHDPWSNIGYWGDHQIVYLLRLLEAWEAHEPGSIATWLDRRIFVSTDVPYLLADYDEMVLDPRQTITFDEPRADEIARRRAAIGADGSLLVDADGATLRSGLAEKLLLPALAKLSSFVPGGGIWLNTQRPEWNDANNALAGPGLSMVTLYYLRRYLAFLDAHLANAPGERVALQPTVATWCNDLRSVLEQFAPGEAVGDDRLRRSVLDGLGAAGTAHRHRVRAGLPPSAVEVPIDDLRRLVGRALAHLDASIEVAHRSDGLYQSYNMISFPDADTVRVDHLGPMLEGQVAVLSSGTLTPSGALGVIDALFASGMHRDDLDTFLLYPPVELPAFVDRNVVPTPAPWTSDDLDGELRQVLVADPDGRLRFRPGLVNAAALDEALATTTLDAETRREVAEQYERVFNHRSFTGRSASMYGYEGIGSVYWHMVSKLLLAVHDCYWAAVDAGADPSTTERLAQAYRRIRAGLGFNKTPSEFGAFPTDCYSHTPGHSGAQQPGMTGQVKEEILTRFGEIGLRVVDGRLVLEPGLLPLAEVLDGSDGVASLTYAATPVTITRGERDTVVVTEADGTRRDSVGLALSVDDSRRLLDRTGRVAAVDFTIGPASSS